MYNKDGTNNISQNYSLYCKRRKSDNSIILGFTYLDRDDSVAIEYII